MNYCCVSGRARISICAVGFNNEAIVWVWSPGVSSPPPAHSTQALLESANLQFNSHNEPNTAMQNVLWHLDLTENEHIDIFILKWHIVSGAAADDCLFASSDDWLLFFFQFVVQSSWFSLRFVSVHVDKRSDVSYISIYLVERSEEEFFLFLFAGMRQVMALWRISTQYPEYTNKMRQPAAFLRFNPRMWKQKQI